MADDFVINVRQVAEYPYTPTIGASDAILVQPGGVGGPYAWTNAAAIVNGATLTSFTFAGNIAMSQDLAVTGSVTLGPTAVTGSLFASGNIEAGIQLPSASLPEGQVLAGQITISKAGNLTINAYLSNDDTLSYLAAGYALGLTQTADGAGHLLLYPTGPMAAALGPPLDFMLTQTGDLLVPGTVFTSRSFNGPWGPNELVPAAYVDARIDSRFVSPVLTGYARATTPQATSNDCTIATTAFVHAAITADLLLGPTIENVVLTGTTSAPTAAANNNSTTIATTAFVMNAVNAGVSAIGANYAPLNNANLTGVPTAPTANVGTSTAQLATTAFVQAAVAASTAGVSSFNTRTGAVTLNAADITNVGGALIGSPTFTGVPSAPTAGTATNTTQIATTAFVHAALTAGAVASFNTRTGAVTLTTADITGAGGAPIASPTFTGVPLAPTASVGTATPQIATTQFVANAIGITSWNGRTGAVTMLAADVTAVGGALVASPTFTGTPAAPTAAPGTNTTQLATTGFVTAALAAVVGVASWNGRTGAVTLTAADLTGAGGALLAGPAFTGIPTAPTATAGTNTGQLATTAFVMGEFAAIGTGVTSWNTRTGAVTLGAADITGAGGALLASPTFSGIPTAPNPLSSDNSTQIATTNFVRGVIGALPAGVSSWNGRNGTVNMTSTDVTNAGGALLAGATFTGTITAPTVGANTSLLVIDQNTTTHYWSMTSQADNWQLSHSVAGGALIFTSAKQMYPFTDNQFWCGVPGHAWYTVEAYAFTNASDKTKKTNLQPLPDQCTQLMENIEPQRYEWISSPQEDRGRTHWGFIAQQVKSIMDRYGYDFGGHHESADGEQSLSYNELLAVLWKAVQELAVRIDTLETRSI